MNLTQSQQETWNAFQRVKTHLLTQMKKSITPGGDCSYRDYNGLSCAIGCLIPDEIYNDKIEGYIFGDLLNIKNHTRFNHLSSIVKKELIQILNPLTYELDSLMLGDKLQSIHDMDDVVNWESQLNNLEQELLTSFKG